MNKSKMYFLTISYWIAMLCEGASKIIIPFYFSKIGFSAGKIAWMFFVYEAIGMATNYYSGIFVNKYGYKKAFILSLIFHTIASFGYLAPQGLLKAMIFLTILRVYRGIGKELIKTTSSAYFKIFSVDKGNHSAIHLLLGGKDSFKGLGLLSGAYLYTFMGFRFSFALLGGATAALLVLTPFLIEDYREKKKVTYAGFFNVSNVMFQLSIIRTFLYIGRDIWSHIPIPLYLVSIGMSKTAIGTMMAVGLLIFGATQTYAGIFIKQQITIKKISIKSPWPYQTVLPAFSLLLALVPMSMIVLIEYGRIMYCLVIAYNFFAAFATAPHNYLHVALAKPERAAADIAFYKTISDIGSVIAVGCSGFIYDQFGLLGCLSVAIFAIFISGSLSFFLPKAENDEK